MKKSPLRILHLEDDPNDAELVRSMLVKEGLACDVVRVETRADFLAAVEQGGFDLILGDYTLPSFDGLSALAMAREKCADVPFIFISGTLGEERAIESLKSGATDYVLKQAMSRLVPSVHRALREAEALSERKRAEEALRRSEQKLQTTNQQLHALSRRLLQVQETERLSLARELHDEIGQLLTTAKLNIESIEGLADSDFAPRLKETIGLLDRLLEQLHHVSLNLRPPLLDDLGLMAALGWYIDEQSQRAGLEAEFVGDSSIVRSEEEIESVCFRVAQEAVTNVLRHAQAQKLTVTLAKEGETLHLVVRDDGVGFDFVAARARTGAGQSFGLMGMEERMALVGGRLEYVSAPDKGTEVHAYFPLTESSADLEAEDP